MKKESYNIMFFWEYEKNLVRIAFLGGNSKLNCTVNVVALV